MRTLFRLFRAGFHTTLLFFLPWGIGALLGTVLDIEQVASSAKDFARMFVLVALPLLVLQVVAIGVKVSRELRMARAEGVSGFVALVDALDRHVRILTERGMGMAVASLLMIGAALAAKFAELGVLAITGLGIVYIASTLATVVSAFSVRGFDARLMRRRGGIDRELAPSVVNAGEPVEERFCLTRVPVPPGFRLHIEEALPERLGGHTRFSLDRTVSRRDVTVTAPLAKTPRGVFHVGPADIGYEDVLGLTRVFVASRAKATLRCLPPLRPVMLGKKPRSEERAEGSATMLALLPSDEYFRTRPYVPGDDTRRVHWKQSLKQGKLILRVPETIPITPTRVRLVLDTFVPARSLSSDARLDEVLDLLVESWTALANALLQRGERVSLVVASVQNGSFTVRELECKRGQSRLWRSLGSEASWQSSLSLDRVLESLTPTSATSPERVTRGETTRTVVFSCGIGPFAHCPAGSHFVVADGASVVPEERLGDRSRLERLLRFSYPAGADDNRLDWAALLEPSRTRSSFLKGWLARSMQGLVAFASSNGGSPLIARRRGEAISLESP